MKTISGIVTMSGILSLVFLTGASDVPGMVQEGELAQEVIRLGITTLSAGGIWMTAGHLENCRKK